MNEYYIEYMKNRDRKQKNIFLLSHYFNIW